MSASIIVLPGVAMRSASRPKVVPLRPVPRDRLETLLAEIERVMAEAQK